MTMIVIHPPGSVKQIVFIYFPCLRASPINDCHWVEYGRQHMTFYDLQSFTKNDIVRTQIYLPQRFITYEKPDPAMGQPLAMTIVSACFTHFGDFYVLDNQLGLHIVSCQVIPYMYNWKQD